MPPTVVAGPAASPDPFVPTCARFAPRRRRGWHSRWVKLRDLGARVRLFDADYDDIGIAYAPRPVDLGDLLVRADGSAWRIVSVLDLDEAVALDALCVVEPV